MRGSLGLSLVVSVVAACSVSGTAPARDDGEQTFANVCAKCHGQSGTGGIPLSDGGPAPRDLTDPKWQDSVIDEQIEAIVRTGKPPMPAFQSVLTNEQIRAVVVKVRNLRKKAAP